MAQAGLRGPRRGRRRLGGGTGSGYSENLILLAAAMASQLACGRTECELETLINLLDFLQDALVGILSQRRIQNRQQTEILQDGDFIV